jgi:hypothetical protein
MAQKETSSKSRRWLGLSGAAVLVANLVLTGTTIAFQQEGEVNHALGIEGGDASYGGTEFSADGTLSDASYEKYIEAAYQFCEQEEEEGSVLLYNRNNALPLSESERNVTVFGRGSIDPVFRSTAGGSSTNPDYQKTPVDALQDAGFNVNQTVLDAYASAEAPKERSVSSVGEYDPALFTGSVTDSFASYGDVAFVTLSRFATEGNDLAMVNDKGKRMLELDDNEKAIFQQIKDSGKFKKTVVLLNSVFAMEMDWLDEYNVDAVLWVGNPGFYGMPGAIRVVTGEVNPSGHTTATFAANSLSAPSAENFGLHAYNYGSKTPRAAGDSFVSYNEGIYVGYRYYETRYEDTILGQGNADSTVGTKASTDGWNYAEEVCFPFGYGLSYTNYEYSLDKLDYNSDTDTFTATVTVSNTGDRDGKATVELYGQSPYTDYDKQNNVEKSSIQLLGYDKIDVAAGASETVTVDVPGYFLASYDANGAKGYILDAGDYYFAVGNGAHEALNNVLAAKCGDAVAGKLIDHDGNVVTGNTAAEGKDIYNEGDITFDGTNTQMDGGMVMAKGTVAVNNSQVSMAELDARAGNITVTGSELSVSKLTGNTLGSSLTVGTDGIVNIGNLDTTKLGEAMNDAGMGSGSAVLALNTSVTLDNNARIVVGKDASQNTATAVFGENSLLVVDAEGVTGNQVIHADGDDSKTAFIHSGAQLRIINAVAGEYVTVLNGFDTIMNEHDELEAGWVNNQGVENLDYMLSSYATIVEGPDGQPDVVVVSELNDPTEVLPGIDPDLAPVLNEVWANKLNDVDSPDMGVRFLSRAARADYINGDAAKSAATIESAARIAFAGAVPQMTRMASDAATNAVVNRLGFANPADGAHAMNAEGQIVDRNTTGFALWIAPLWQSQHGWGMEAGNLDYGFNGNLGGVSLGADYTFENAIRAGITFNIGGGYAETSGGDLNSTQNNMNFWGLGAYAGWNYENFAVMADVSYTSTWNQLEQDLDPGMGMGDLEADVQATAISAGLRAEYKLETSVLDVIPHVGVRYMSLNTWGYDVDARGGTVMEGDGFHQDIWTFPVGVTFSKDFTLDSGWFFKPSLDFSVIPAAGDIKAKEDVRFTGAPAVAEMETQMMDYLTWQGGVGLEMGNDTMSFGVNYTLQAGQHTTGHGVFGSFRYEF